MLSSLLTNQEIQQLNKIQQPTNSYLLKNNVHVDTDPNTKLKFIDGGQKFMDELETSPRNELESPIYRQIIHEETKQIDTKSQDIMNFVIKMYNKSANFKGIESVSPFQKQMAVPVSHFFSVIDKNQQAGYSNYLSKSPLNIIQDMMIKAR